MKFLNITLIILSLIFYYFNSILRYTICNIKVNNTYNLDDDQICNIYYFNYYVTKKCYILYNKPIYGRFPCVLYNYNIVHPYYMLIRITYIFIVSSTVICLIFSIYKKCKNLANNDTLNDDTLNSPLINSKINTSLFNTPTNCTETFHDSENTNNHPLHNKSVYYAMDNI